MKTLLTVLLFCFSLTAHSQGLLETRMMGNEKGKSLQSVFSNLQKANNIRFYFQPEWIENLTCSRDYDGEKLEILLDDVLIGTNLYYLVMDERSMVIIQNPDQVFSRRAALKEALRRSQEVTSYQIGKRGHSTQDLITIQGLVTDTKTGDPLPYTTIQVSNDQMTTVTNESGRYKLALAPGIHVLTFSFVDYDQKVIDLEVYADGKINVEMEMNSVMLDEIVVQDRAAREVVTNRIGLTQLEIGEIKRAPSFMGEADLVKQVQNLPGVTTVGEAAAGFNVRGGGVDQNLILYDGMPVFNSSHVFGFFSAFNPDGIRNASFYRGGIPAEYGGRASSVLDIQSRDGDFKVWNAKAGIGMLTGNLMVDGPVKKEKTSMAASIRSTYSNWLLHSLRTDYADLSKSSVSFYDGTFKIAHKADNGSKLALTGYASNDAFNLMGDSTYQWSNYQLSGQANYQISPQIESTITAGISSYAYRVVNEDPQTASELSFRITTTVGKADFRYLLSNHTLHFGQQLIYYQFNPGSLEPTSKISNAANLSLDKQHALEQALYLSDEWQVNPQFTFESGLRIPIFTSFGPANVNQYANDAPRSLDQVVDTLRFGPVAPIKIYTGLEPRLSFRWMTSPRASVKLGYNRIYQYLHLVTNTAAVTPLDIWQPSGYYFKPQRSDQVSLGYFRDFKAKSYSISVEGFYKAIDNLLDFKDGADLVLNRHLETELLQGKGYSYGAETTFAKNNGWLTGTINYTYSRSYRLIRGATPAESINEGKKYPSNFDQPHILNLSWKMALSRRHYFTGNFTYHTGRPITIPLSVIQFEDGSATYFSSRNQYRIPDYHRLDLAFIIEGNHKRKAVKGTWVFSVYNAYGRRNPYSIFFKNAEDGIPRPYQLSIIGTVFPSISFNLTY